MYTFIKKKDVQEHLLNELSKMKNSSWYSKKPRKDFHFLWEMYDHKYGVKNYDSSALRIAPSTIKALETKKIGMKSGRPKYMKDNG